MTLTCKECGETIHDGETVKAVVETKFKRIPSRVHYALAVPKNCEAVYHINCWLGRDD